MYQRANLIWAFVIVATTLVLLLRAVNLISDGLFDLFIRAWPVLLVLAGLTLLLHGRVVVGSLIALVLSAGLVGGVAFVAYSSRLSERRTDNQVEIFQEFKSDATLIVLNVNTLTTDVEILSTDSILPSISGEFIGSSESDIVVEMTGGDAGTVELTISEEQTAEFPSLEAVGRGKLMLQLPSELAFAIAFGGQDGEVTLNLDSLWLEQLSVELDKGDLLVTLPEYLPRSPNAAERPGNITVYNGDATLVISPDVSARLELNRGGNDTRPQFDDSYILIDDGADGTLEKRTVSEDDTPLYYVVTAPQGIIRLAVGE